MEATLSWNCVVAGIVILAVLFFAFKVARENRRWRPMSLSRLIREFLGTKSWLLKGVLALGIVCSFLRLRTPLAMTLGFGTVIIFALIEVCGSLDQFALWRCLLRDVVIAFDGHVDPAGAAMCLRPR